VTSATLYNLLKYGGTAALAMLVGMLPILIGQLDSDAAINWRPIVSAGLSALLASLTATSIATRLSRVGEEEVSNQSSELKARGIPRHEQVVVSQAEASKALGDPLGIPPAD
jgi:hypothetical protein